MTVPIEPGSRLAAMGNQLIEIHLWLREELARLREDADAYLAAGVPAIGSSAGDQPALDAPTAAPAAADPPTADPPTADPPTADPPTADPPTADLPTADPAIHNRSASESTAYGLPALAAHCAAFCSALRRHHTAEDAGAFVVLGERFPQLRPVIAELERDHRMVTDILRRMEELLGAAGLDPLTANPFSANPRGFGPRRADPAEARRIRAELDGLSALLESHFTYEEKRLSAALNSLDTGAGGVENLLGIRVPPSG